MSTIEYATDSTRTIASLLFSGTAARFPEIRFIFSHGGRHGALSDRPVRAIIGRAKGCVSAARRGSGIKKVLYEVAQANHASARDALLTLVPPSNVLFGSDYPFRPVI